MAIVEATQTSCQQIAWFLLGYPLVWSSRAVVNVKTCIPEKKFFMFNSIREDGFEAGFGDEGDDIPQLDKHIRNFMSLKKCERVCEMSLYDFLSRWKKTTCAPGKSQRKSKTSNFKNQCETLHCAPTEQNEPDQPAQEDTDHSNATVFIEDKYKNFYVPIQEGCYNVVNTRPLIQATEYRQHRQLLVCSGTSCKTLLRY
jgi:hypothetical protein